MFCGHLLLGAGPLYASWLVFAGGALDAHVLLHRGSPCWLRYYIRLYLLAAKARRTQETRRTRRHRHAGVLQDPGLGGARGRLERSRRRARPSWALDSEGPFERITCSPPRGGPISRRAAVARVDRTCEAVRWERPRCFSIASRPRRLVRLPESGAPTDEEGMEPSSARSSPRPIKRLKREKASRPTAMSSERRNAAKRDRAGG